MTATELDLSRAAWRKSTHSNNGGNCIEIAPAPGAIAIRDTADPDGPKLAFTARQWTAIHRHREGITPRAPGPGSGQGSRKRLAPGSSAQIL
jgi:hypothetical protein